jgi:hypothetical protein
VAPTSSSQQSENPEQPSKTHGSDLYLSPQSLVPRKPITASDNNYSGLHKKTISEPYKFISIQGYHAVQPWSAPAALGKVDLAIIAGIQRFPTVEELDNEFDGWPVSGNPFNQQTVLTTPANPAPIENRIQTFQATLKNKATIVADLVNSKDKLFFIAYAPDTTSSQARREWKLVTINFETSLRHHPSCLQDGRFLAKFLIAHHRDAKLDISDRRFWLEYNFSNPPKCLGIDYHILQPLQYSAATEKSKQLVSYREWINISDPELTIHGPFNFATLNNRKTRDRISATDWKSLAESQAKYHNHAPQLSPPVL